MDGGQADRWPFDQRQKVRILGGRVHPAIHNANLSPELPGDVLSLASMHAKVRRAGYGK